MSSDPGVFCEMCGTRHRVELHHLSGRGPGRERLDVGLVIPLCRRHHTFFHAELRAQGLDVAPVGLWSPLGSEAHRLARWAPQLSRIAENTDHEWLALLSSAMREQADRLYELDAFYGGGNTA